MCIRDRDNRRLAEVKEIHKKVGALAPVTGAHYRAEVGIVKDYDNIWDAGLDRWHPVSYTHLDVYKRQVRMR